MTNFGTLRDANTAEPEAPTTLTRAAKERAMAEMVSRLTGVSENLAYAAVGTPGMDFAWFCRRQCTLRAAVMRLAMARTCD